MTKIQLKTKILLGGKVASPDDKNKGIYDVHKNLASSLVARKRAVFYNANEPKKTKDGVKNIELSLDDAKKVADELGLKYNANIGLAKLLEKIDAELEKQAKEYNLEIKEISIAEAMKLYRAAKEEKTTKAEDPEKLQKLKDLAEEAEIEYNEDATCEELEKHLVVELEKYASEEKIEVPENADVFTIWELIKEKLQNAN